MIPVSFSKENSITIPFSNKKVEHSNGWPTMSMCISAPLDYSGENWVLDPSNTFRSRAQESDSPSKLPCPRESGKQRYHRRLIWTRGAQWREHGSGLPHAGRSRKRGNLSVQEQSAPRRKFSLLVLRAVASHGSCATRTEQETEEARQHNG